jgi:hypothetical protein
VTPCATVQYAIDQHRVSPTPTDVIDIGPGTFVGNAEAADAADDGLTIRGALAGGIRQTTLRGDGTGVSGSFIAVQLGSCGATNVTLRDVNVDTVDADPNVEAVELNGGSDLINVHASSQPASSAFAVVEVCDPGSTIGDSEIVATETEIALFVTDNLRLRGSTVSAENGSVAALYQLGGADTALPLQIRRSQLSLPETNPAPVVRSTTRLIVDSSLITGGGSGVEMAGDQATWQVDNSTIDAGEAGVSDPVNTPGLNLEPDSFGPPADVTVDSSILVDGLRATTGDGQATCDYSDLPSTSQGVPFEIDCDTGGATTNSTTDPLDLFLGGSPFDWRLKSTAPAIDSGAPGAIPPDSTTKDLAGNPRRLAGSAATCPNGTRDKGAYEYLGPPCLIQEPAIIGGANPTPGTQLSSTVGEFSNKPSSYARLWLRCDAAGDNCAEIAPPRTRKGYSVRGADVGHTLRLQVIASNAGGESEPGLSDPTGVVSE